MKRIALVTILMLLAAACGDSTTTTDAGGTVSTEPPTTEPPTTDPPLGAGPYPVGTLEITVTHPEAEEITYTISCLGDTATVIGDVEIDERRACEALADPEVQARLIDGQPDDLVCTEQYGGPDLAEITGTLDDQSVDTVIDRANGCGIDDWDRLLADVLPPAVGVTE